MLRLLKAAALLGGGYLAFFMGILEVSKFVDEN